MQKVLSFARRISHPILFVALIFSYFPLMSFGDLNGLHLDISLLYIIVLGYILLAAPVIASHFSKLRQGHLYKLLIIFSLYQTFSVFWSANPVRGVITAGFMWMMVALVSSLIINADEIGDKKLHIIHILYIGIIGLVAVAVWQIIGDAIGVSPIFTLLPESYRSAVFGIARPVGFAAEPQFLGSLLLFPLLFSVWLGLKSPKNNYKTGVMQTLLTMTLLLTLSRGAMGAGLLGAIIIVLSSRPPLRRFGRVCLYAVTGVLLAGCVVFGVASLNQRDNISGGQAVSKVVNQLSLGSVSLTNSSPKPTQSIQKYGPAPPTNGYVESSTASRLTMSQQALSLWAKAPSRVLFGIGSGSFGASLHQKDSRYRESSVVNNYYIEMLTELGLVGMAIFAAFILWLLYRLSQARLWLFVAALAAFLLQWYFFSGNANVIHIWVVIAVAMMALSRPRNSVKHWQHLLQ